MNLPNVNNLAYFLGTYFNQDCFDRDPNIESIIKRFISEEPPEFVEAVTHQLTGFVEKKLSEDQIMRFVYECGCYYNPYPDFESAQQWLEYILSLMKAK